MRDPRPTAASPLLDRRGFLIAAASLASTGLWGCGAPVARAPKLSAYPFQLGIASGEPSADGMVLWTRLAPDPLNGGGMPPEAVTVAWEVADDERMTRIVRRGTAQAIPELAHSVHVEVSGLRPDRWYWYRFALGADASAVGRTRTLPRADAAAARLRFAVASCQHYEMGLFTAYEHMAREDLDLVLFVGDYIYEYAGQDKRVRKHLGGEIMALADYRNRYAQYKADPALQAMHAAVPWLVSPDDHEFDDNCAGDIPRRTGTSRADHLARRAAAYQAYYEHMPLRRSALPKGPDMLLHRRFAYGRLADLSMLDTRQYRTDQPCGDGNKPPCPEALDPAATMLGATQRDWLLDGLGRSTAGWNVLVQQVMMARVDRVQGEVVAHSMDQWPGYEMERRGLLKAFHERRIANPVVLSGDIHTNWGNELIADFDGLEGRVVGSEFVATSISSGGDGVQKPKGFDQLLAENPFVRFHNAERGYLRCEVTPTLWRTDFRTVPFVLRPGAPLNTRASLVVEAGRMGVKPT